MSDPARSEAPYGPLRRDVRLLGSLLGRVLVEQEGEDFLAAEEHVRAALAPLTRGRRPVVRPRRRARAAAGEAGTDARAFGLYFQLANTAEQHHRIRRRREVTGEVRAPRESLAEAFEPPREVSPEDELERRLQQVSLQLVLTAHPTEATRRTLLRAHVRIAELLARGDDPDLTARRARGARVRARRGDHDPLADRRGAPRPAAGRRRDPPRAVVLRGEPVRRGRAAAARLPPPLPGRAAAVLVRELDRRRPRRQPGGRTARRSWRRSSARASRCSRRYRDDVRELSVALASSRSLVGVSARARGVDRARRARVRRLPRRRGA